MKVIKVFYELITYLYGEYGKTQTRRKGAIPVKLRAAKSRFFAARSAATKMMLEQGYKTNLQFTIGNQGYLWLFGVGIE